jgi:hypothetical protein
MTTAVTSLLRIRRRGVKFNAEGAQYFDDCREARVAIARKGLVEALAPHARLLREIGHAFRPCHEAESMGEERRVTVLKNGVNVGCNLFVAPQCSGAIPGNCLRRHFDLHFQIPDASVIACAMSLAWVSFLPPANSTIRSSPHCTKYTQTLAHSRSAVPRRRNQPA